MLCLANGGVGVSSSPDDPNLVIRVGSASCPASGPAQSHLPFGGHFDAIEPDQWGAPGHLVAVWTLVDENATFFCIHTSEQVDG